MAEINITFSALSPKLADQITAQGLDFDPEKLRIVQMKADAVSICTIHSLIPPSASTRAWKRLVAEVGKAIRPRETSHGG